MQFANSGIQVLSDVEIDMVAGGLPAIDSWYSAALAGAVAGGATGAVYGTFFGGAAGTLLGGAAGAIGGAIGATAGYLWQ